MNRGGVYWYDRCVDVRVGLGNDLDRGGGTWSWGCMFWEKSIFKVQLIACIPCDQNKVRVEVQGVRSHTCDGRGV